MKRGHGDAVTRGQGEKEMKKKTKHGYSVTIVLTILMLVVYSGNADAMLTAKANHDHITIDFFYHGSTVGVKGVSDAGRDLVIKITSPEGHQVMKQKGKVAGFLWMNVGMLKFENTPNLYEVFSTRKVEDILTPEQQKKHTLGYAALADHVEIGPLENAAEKTQWFGEFVKFKEDSNLYKTDFGKIEMKDLPDGHQEYFIQTQWPYQAAPGEYLVSVYAVKDGKVVEQAESHVKVEQVGMVKTLAGMAKDSAALYGFLSVGIALSAGFGVGMVFRKGGGSH
jgi:uncharacterized protein (TIGR02186 family)